MHPNDPLIAFLIVTVLSNSTKAEMRQNRVTDQLVSCGKIYPNSSMMSEQTVAFDVLVALPQSVFGVN